MKNPQEEQDKMFAANVKSTEVKTNSFFLLSTIVTFFVYGMSTDPPCVTHAHYG